MRGAVQRGADAAPGSTAAPPPRGRREERAIYAVDVRHAVEVDVGAVPSELRGAPALADAGVPAQALRRTPQVARASRSRG